MSTNKVNMSLDDIISERRNTTRSFRGRGRDNRGRRGGRGRDRGGRDEGRGGRDIRGRGRRQNYDRENRNNRRFDRDDRRPRRDFGRGQFRKSIILGGTRLFVKDLPKTVSNNDLRVYIFNLGNIRNLRKVEEMWNSLG
jgi:hypothetical protein